MPKFNVLVTRDCTESTVVDVEASSPEDAKGKGDGRGARLAQSIRLDAGRHPERRAIPCRPRRMLHTRDLMPCDRAAGFVPPLSGWHPPPRPLARPNR
jgi:hypothetical protein